MSAPITLNLNKSAGLLNLTKAVPALKAVKGLLTWEPSPIHKASLTEGFDLDIFAFVLNDREKISGGDDVVFFNNKFYPNQAAAAVAIPRDNRTGEGDDDEEITIDFTRLPADKKFVDIYVFIHDAAQRRQTFGMMSNAAFEVFDNVTNKSIVRYNLSQYTNETTLHVGRFEVTTDGLVFSPYGEVATADPNSVVNTYYP